MKSNISQALKNEYFDYIVIDGKNQVFKYQHTMRYLKNKQGIETGVYHGFMSLVLRLREEYINSHIIIAWEGGDLVRKKQLSTYKDNRSKTENSLITKINHLKNMLGMLGVDQKFIPGYEADDVAATVVNKYKDKKILLVTEDRDWFQTMNENTFVMRKNKIYNYEDIKKQEGFSPEKYKLYVLLKGKKGNNVEGIPYFPEKLARNIIGKSSSIKEILEYIPEEEKDMKWREILISTEKELNERLKIITLKNDAELEDIPCKGINHSQLKKILNELEMFKVLTMIKTVRRLIKENK